MDAFVKGKVHAKGNKIVFEMEQERDPNRVRMTTKPPKTSTILTKLRAKEWDIHPDRIPTLTDPSLSQLVYRVQKELHRSSR